MRVAYVTTYDSSDVQNWSGLGYFIARALEQQSIELIRIGPLQTHIDYFVKGKLFSYRYIARKNYHRDREPRILRSYAAQVAKALKDINVDVVFSPGTIPICYLECSRPIAFWTDATFAGMIDFYPSWSNLCRETVVNGNRMEAAALSRCRLAIYSSEWAANTAIGNYPVNPSKVRVVPFGANIDAKRCMGDITAISTQRSTDICRLLFIGVEWYRKGGDMAVALARSLNARGVKTELTIVGCDVPRDLPAFASAKGFVSKATSAGRAVLDRLFAESHFLVLPSRADCVPVVIAEANSFGIPVVTTNVGGIPTLVRDGVNGASFPIDTFVEQACNFVETSMKSIGTYQELAESSFGEYERTLSWQVAGKRVKDFLEELCT